VHHQLRVEAGAPDAAAEVVQFERRDPRRSRSTMQVLIAESH